MFCCWWSGNSGSPARLPERKQVERRQSLLVPGLSQASFQHTFWLSCRLMVIEQNLNKKVFWKLLLAKFYWQWENLAENSQHSFIIQITCISDSESSAYMYKVIPSEPWLRRGRWDKKINIGQQTFEIHSSPQILCHWVLQATWGVPNITPNIVSSCVCWT